MGPKPSKKITALLSRDIDNYNTGVIGSLSEHGGMRHLNFVQEHTREDRSRSEALSLETFTLLSLDNCHSVIQWHKLSLL